MWWQKPTVIATAYNVILRKSVVVTSENKRVQIPYIPLFSYVDTNNVRNFSQIVRGFLYGEFGRSSPATTSICFDDRTQLHKLKTNDWKCITFYTFWPAPKNIRIPVQDNWHGENPEFVDFVTNYVSIMSLSEKQAYVLAGYQIQKFKNSQCNVVGHDLIGDIMNSWNKTCFLEVMDCETDTVTY